MAISFFSFSSLYGDEISRFSTYDEYVEYLAKFRSEDDPLRSEIFSTWKDRLFSAEKVFEAEGTSVFFANLAFDNLQYFLGLDKNLPYFEKARKALLNLYYPGHADAAHREYYSPSVFGPVYFGNPYDYLIFRKFIAVNSHLFSDLLEALNE